MHETLWLTELINRLFGPSFAALAEALGLPYDKHLPLGDHVVETWLVMALLLTAAILIRRRLTLVPGKAQQVAELVVLAFRGLLEDVIGPKGKRYLGLIGSLGLFILIGNLIGMIPECASPTHNYNTTLACTLIVFCYYHFQGIREQGLLKYLKHFAGPLVLLAPLMVVIELIGHLARILSLSMRLFGNMMAEHIIALILLTLVPYFVPLPMMALGILVSIVQAFIFVLLSTIYIAGAVATEEH